MDLFKEIDDLSDLFPLEKNTKLDSAVEEYQDLQSRYSSLHEDYAKEMENSKKVGKCLVKCLKFYSKLCKGLLLKELKRTFGKLLIENKYEAQQKVISRLEETVKEKVICLEEAQRNEEKMKGLIQVYRSERTFYVGETINDLRKDKEILLDICCRLIGESVRNNNIRNLTNLLLRKFKKDLDHEKLNLMKRKSVKFKNESECDAYEDVKSYLMSSLKNEAEFKTEEKYSGEMTEASESEEPDAKNDPLDLSMGRVAAEENRYPEENPSAEWEEIPPHEPEFVSGLPLLEDLSPPPRPPCAHTEKTCEANLLVSCAAKGNHFQQTVTESTERTLREGSGGCDAEVPREESSGMPGGPGSDSAAASNLKNYLSGVPSREDLPFCSRACPGSIFDISDASLQAAGFKTEAKEQEYAAVDSEVEFSYCFVREERLNECRESEKLDGLKVNFRDADEEPDEEELFKIIKETSSMRLPSPVREISDSLVDVLREKKMCDLSRGAVSKRRGSTAEEESWCKSKRLRDSEERPSGSLVESIMSAMSLQNKEFRSKGSGSGEGGAECGAREAGCRFSSLGTRTYSRKKKFDGGNSKENSTNLRQSPRTRQNKQKEVESIVMEEIKNFVSSPILCKEDADENVKQCLSVLSCKPEEVIAKCIVATVLENIDEEVETFERPAPPLTKTQHRLIVLLSVFRTLDASSDKISTSILSIILEKLFPDNFFWPDDSVEAATRFYVALCRARNDPKTLWRFCLQAMTDMRQRCPLLVFTALKTWPDVLHDATTLKNNLLAVTLVNIFLHMPKTEGLRNFNQGRKLVALKHLLMNFYQFKVEDTIEGCAKKIMDAVGRQEAGADKSLVLLCKCRGASWTMKHVMPRLKVMLGEWSEERADDVVAMKVLSVMKNVCPAFVQENTDEAKVRDLVCYLSEILISGKRSHAAEVSVVEVLLQLKQYPEARKMIREWIPKSPINECLRNEIINASAENILRELRLNKRKEARSISLRKRLKKQSKKSKGKKKKGKGKKRKMNESMAGTESVGASS